MIQLILSGFEKPKSPNLKRMHVIDAGQEMAKFECSRCGFVSEWLSMDSHSQIKRGLPCPFCYLVDESVNLESPHTITSGLLCNSCTFGG
jgi:hypothetical protein